MRRKRNQNNSSKYPYDYFTTIEGRKGKQRVHITGYTEQETREKEAVWAKRLESGYYGSGMITVREWTEKWYEDKIKSRKMTEKSRSMYPTIINRWILPVIGDIPLERLTAYDCQLCIDRMNAQSKSYQKKCKSILQAIVKSAYNAERLSRDVSCDVTVPKSAEVRLERRALTPAEREAVERVCMQETLADGRRNDSGALYLTMLYCGLRPGECCALRKEDLDFGTLTIHVRQARERGSTTIKTPKTKAGKRDVPMTEAFAAWLELWLQAHPTDDSCPYVWAQHDHKTIITDASLKRRWDTYKQHIARELGADQIVTKPGRKKSVRYDTNVVTFDPYCLRHSYATELILAGVDRWDIARYMGHSSPAVVEKTYGHPEDLLDRESREKLEAHRREYQKAHPGGVDPRDLAQWAIGDQSYLKQFEESLRESRDRAMGEHALKTAEVMGDKWRAGEYAQFVEGMFDAKKRDETLIKKYNAAYLLPDMIKAYKMEIERLQPYKNDPEVSKWIDKYAAEVSEMEEELRKKYRQNEGES